MTFLAPLFLLALAALAIPILIHLLRRRESRTLDFPALRYLTRTTREQARIIRLRQLLLLALRIAALALIVLAAARLVLPLGGRDDPPAGLAIVVDNGLTSGTVLGTSRVLDSLVARAQEALDRAGERDLVWIVAAGEPWSASVPLSPEEARIRLASLAPTHVTGNLGGALARAAALMEAGAPELREIVLVSDLRSGSLDSVEAAGGLRAQAVRIAPPPTITEGNRGVAELLVSGGLTPRAGETAELLVRVTGPDLDGTLVRAYLGDLLVATGRTGPEGLAILPLPVLEAGWVRGRVEIDPDDLRGDDAAYFAFRAVPSPVVTRTGRLSPYLDDALAVLTDAGRIRTGTGAGTELFIVGVGGPVPPPSAAPVLLVPPDDPALLPSLNVLLAALAPGWRIEARTAGEQGDREITGGTVRSLLPSLPKVHLAHDLVGPEGGEAGETLLSLADGSPWLLRIRGSGRPVLLLASPLTLEASGLPASSAMVPLLDLLTTSAGDSPQGVSVLAGSPVPAPQGASAVRVPDGTTRAHAGGPDFVETGIAGIYEFAATGSRAPSFFAVNAATPALGPSLDREEAARRLAVTWEGTTGAEPWPDVVLSGRRGREVWKPLAALLLLVLVAEGWLAAYGGHGAKEKSPVVARP